MYYFFSNYLFFKETNTERPSIYNCKKNIISYIIAYNDYKYLILNTYSCVRKIDYKEHSINSQLKTMNTQV